MIAKALITLTLVAVLTNCTVTRNGELPQSVVNTTRVGVSLYCETFHNVHRIAMRLVHVVDPEWKSVCVQYFKMKEKDNI